MRKIAIINQKGGVGKTTSCCNLGAAIAATGRNVLLLDLDPQAHLTMHYGVEPTGDTPGIYEVLTDNMPIDEATVAVRERICLVPSHIDLAAAEMELVSVVGRERILVEAVEKTNQSYDFMIIDCPPSLGVLTVNALAAVTEVIIPLQPHFLALQGVGKLLESISLIKSRINPQLSVSGIILCMHEATTRLAGEVAADLQSFLDASRGTDKAWANARVYESTIRRNIKLAECPSYGQTIFEYEQRSNGAADYARLAAEILGDHQQLTAKAIAASFAKRETLAESADVKSPDIASSDAEPVVASHSDAATTDSIDSIRIEDRTVCGPDDIESAPPVPVPPPTPESPPQTPIHVEPVVTQRDTNSESDESPAPVASPDEPSTRIQVVFEGDDTWQPVGGTTGAQRD